MSGNFSISSNVPKWSQINDEFLRRDGQNTPTANISLDNNRIINVLDPVDPQDVATKSYVDSSGGSTDKVSRSGDTMTGALGMTANKIYDVLDPVDPQDAATKSYVDSSGGATNKVSRSGDTMTGALGMTSNKIYDVLDPVDLQDAATKNYVDTSVVTKVDKAGDTMSGILDMGSNSITNVPDPVDLQDAATKNSTDAALSGKVSRSGDTMTGDLFFNAAIAVETLSMGSNSLQTGQRFNVLMGKDGVGFTYTAPTPPFTNEPLQINAGVTGLAVGVNDTDIWFQMGTQDSPYGTRFSGNLDMSNNSITNVLNPLNAQDGATKNYVDSILSSKVSTTGDTMTGTLSMGNHNITNVLDPVNDQDAVTKKYIDDNWLVTATPNMTANVTVSDTGLTYTASALSELGVNNAAWKCFQTTFPSGGWISTVNANTWIQMQYPRPLAMAGFSISARNIVGRSITNWKVQASNDGTTFVDIVPADTTVFDAGILNQFTFPKSDEYSYWRFHIIACIGSDVGIDLFQWIPAIQDVTLRKCETGLVPRLTSNVNYRGFTPAASSENGTGFIAANVFKGDYPTGAGGTGDEWCTAAITTNFWISVECPVPVRLWKLGVRGRNTNTERIYYFKIEGSINNTSWCTLYTSPNPKYLGSSYEELSIESVAKFKWYRLFCMNAQATNPGLSELQLFVYDD